MNSRRTPVIAVLVLAVLAGSPGALLAGCGVCHPCCRPDTVLTIGAASCCPTLQAAPPVETPRATVPAVPAALAVAVPVELPGVAVAELAPKPLPGPPPLHEGIGLYTLNATFLI